MFEAPDLSVKHLRAIVALARFGSFIAAASFLGLSQPGLSRIILQAEELLKVKLFVRGARSVSLSEAGREFVAVAEKMLIDLEQHAQRVRALDGQMRGQLVIASLMSLAHQVLPAALVELRQQHPKLVVRVREGFGPQVAEDVQSGGVDVGIGSAPGGAAQHIVADTVVEERFYAALPRDHRLAGRATVRLEDLAGEPLVSMPIESGLRRAVDLAASARGVALDHSLVTNQFGTLLRLVANGLGVGVVPATVAPPADDAAIAIAPIAPAIKRQVGLMRRADRPLSEPAEAFLKLFAPRFRAATRIDKR